MTDLNGPTPGPWHFDGSAVSAPGSVICDVRPAGTHSTGANGRILAAAPELLAACQALLAPCEENILAGLAKIALAAQLARHAVTKAEGI